MDKTRNVLLASHGTEGAMAAEEEALKICAAGAALKHLIVVPSLWKGMTGDDWLNNGVSRDRFRRYLETELGREVDEHCERVRNKALALNIEYSHEIVVGEPDKCLVNACNEGHYDLLVMGSPRPRGKPGLRSRMATRYLAKKVTLPINTVPYPDV